MTGDDERSIYTPLFTVLWLLLLLREQKRRPILKRMAHNSAECVKLQFARISNVNCAKQTIDEECPENKLDAKRGK